MTESTIPAHPSLEFDRKAAKRLLAAIKQGEPEVIARVRRHHPRFATASDTDMGSARLTDAQLVIAREYGFPSWPAWKHYVEISKLEQTQRVQAFLACVCSNNVFYATQLLKVDDSFTANDICTAAASGNVSALKKCLEDDPQSVNRKAGPLDTTPLVYACQSRLLVVDSQRCDGIVECARILIDAGADPNEFYLNDGGSLRQTPLYGAAGIANHPDLTRMVLDAGADPDDGNRDGPGETLYHVAEFADTRCLEMVLAAGPRQENVDYCLGRAVDFPKHTDAILRFVEAGADVDYPISWFGNLTHLQKAIRHHCDAVVIEAMASRSADIDRPDDNGLTPYRYAIRFGYSEAARILEASGADTRTMPVDGLLGACMQGNDEVVRQLLDQRPDLPSQFQEADHAMMNYAAALLNRRAIPLLSEVGISVDNVLYGMPAFHEACWRGDYETVALMLSLGASLTVKNQHGGTALGAAIYGSVACHDRQGGPRSQPPETVAPRDYARVVDLLLRQGSAVPEELSGSAAVIDVLQRHGVVS